LGIGDWGLGIGEWGVVGWGDPPKAKKPQKKTQTHKIYKI